MRRDKSEDPLNEIFIVYNQNLKILKQKKAEASWQIFYLKRLADVIPFSIFPRDMIREWVKLQNAGFISFKEGLIGELKLFQKLQLEGKHAILCDLTNCMRTYDIFEIENGSFCECKTIFGKQKNYNEHEISSLGKKFVELKQNCEKYIESNIYLDTYQSEIVNLTEKEYRPISTTIFDDAYEVFIIRNSADARNSGLASVHP